MVQTRTGRPFLGPGRAEVLLAVVRDAATAAGPWKVLNEAEASWLLLNCELMPWSVKAEHLLRTR